MQSSVTFHFEVAIIKNIHTNCKVLDLPAKLSLIASCNVVNKIALFYHGSIVNNLFKSPVHSLLSPSYRYNFFQPVRKIYLRNVFIYEIDSTATHTSDSMYLATHSFHPNFLNKPILSKNLPANQHGIAVLPNIIHYHPMPSLPSRDLTAIISALEYNTWFTRLRASHTKLSQDAVHRILHMLTKSLSMEELYLDNIAAKP